MSSKQPTQMSPPDARPPRLGAERATALAGTLFSAALLILTAIHAGPLWRDEINTVDLAQMPIGESWHNMRFESFPPLFPLLLRGCGALGLAGNDVAVRILGFYVALSVLASLWLCARWIGSRAPILTMGLLGSLPAFIFIAGGNRAYGLAACLLALSFGALWRLVESPTRLRMFVAGLICLLYAHCVYYDVVFLAAMLAGGAAVVIWRRDWKTLGGLTVIGAVCAMSLAIYLPIIRQGSAYVPLMQYPHFGFSTLMGKLAESVTAQSSGESPIRHGPEIRVWQLLVLGALAATLFVQRNRTLPKAEAKSAHRAADLALFCSVSMVLGSAGMLAFLYRLHYLTEPWYYLQILIVCGISLDGILGANWPALRPWGLLRIGFMVVMMAHNARAGWQEAHTRRSNLDLIDTVLNQNASAGDFIVVNSAWEGITFARYYHGAANWATVPPVDSHLVHRNDLVFEDMCQTAPMTQVLCDITNALQGGHRVWMLGNMAEYRSGRLPPPPKPCPPARYIGPYFNYWNTQVSAAICDNALTEKVWNVSSRGLISCTENLPMIEFSGYRGGLPASRGAGSKLTRAAHD